MNLLYFHQSGFVIYLTFETQFHREVITFVYRKLTSLRKFTIKAT